MNPHLADGIGIAGGVVMVGAYAYSNVAERIDLTLFNLLNLVGSGCVIVSLVVHFNLPAMLLEIAWAGIAIVGLARGLLGGARR